LLSSPGLRSNIAYRIAHIAPTSFFGDYGCHVRILEEIRALERRGHENTVFTYPTGDDLPGVDIKRNPLQRRRPEVRVGSHWGKLPLDAALLGTTIGHGLRQRFDIVHAHLHEGALIGRLLAWQQRAPLVFDFQGSLTGEMRDHGFLPGGTLLEALIGQAEQIINRLPNRIITSSRHARDLLIGSFGIAPERVVEVSDCVDVDVFRPRADLPGFDLSALRERWRIPPDHLVVGYLGLLAGYQGIPELLMAAKAVVTEFPGCHFLVMGFPGEDTYRRRAAELGLEGHVSFPGRIPYQDAPRMLALADIAVSPKRSQTEGNGKVLNYMAAGLPTVAFDSPVAREFLGVEGSLVAPDAEALAEALLHLLRDPDERTRQGALLRRRAEEHFAWDVGVGRIESVYDELLG
jgi:glycosyltransferase involved in cell wall biosynthesis